MAHAGASMVFAEAEAFLVGDALNAETGRPPKGIEEVPDASGPSTRDPARRSSLSEQALGTGPSRQALGRHWGQAPGDVDRKVT